jgi:hypothetical protein
MSWCIFVTNVAVIAGTVLVAMTRRCTVATNKVVCWVSGYDGDT